MYMYTHYRECIHIDCIRVCMYVCTHQSNQEFSCLYGFLKLYNFENGTVPSYIQ